MERADNSSLPLAVSVDSSTGFVYFVEGNANKIGRLVPATNTITEWSVPTSSSLPLAVSVDSSTGFVYFVEGNANKIGRLVPATNTITEWSVPTSSSLPISLCQSSEAGSNKRPVGALLPAIPQFHHLSILPQIHIAESQWMLIPPQAMLYSQMRIPA